MKTELIDFNTEVWRAWSSNNSWMAWNLFLALVPLALSVWLFRSRRAYIHFWWIGLLLVATFLPKAPFVASYAIRFLRDNRTNYVVWGITLVLIGLDVWIVRQGRSRSLFWWLGFLVFIAFLPNAPYVLTDVIHLVEDIRSNYSIWAISLFVIPLYLLFILTGFEAYVLSLINLGEYMKRQGWGKFILWVELCIHALSAIGIYLGRFLRFNSWDFVTNLHTLADSILDDLAGKRPALVMFVTLVVIAGLYWLMKQVSLGIIWRIESAQARHKKLPNTGSPTTQS